MQKQGFGENYKYPHDYGGFVRESYMPETYEKKHSFIIQKTLVMRRKSRKDLFNYGKTIKIILEIFFPMLTQLNLIEIFFTL